MVDYIDNIWYIYMVNTNVGMNFIWLIYGQYMVNIWLLYGEYMVGKWLMFYTYG